MNNDPSLEIVSVPEEFRRAKRHSLTWSALTALACLGTEYVTSNSNSTPAIFPLGLHFSKLLIIGAAWLCAAFMILGYARAHRLLRLLNSKFLKSRNIERTFEQANELERVVSSSVAEIANAASGADEMLSRSKNLYSSIQQNLRSIANDISIDANSLTLSELPNLLVSPLTRKNDSSSILERESQWNEHFKRMKGRLSEQNSERAKAINGMLDIANDNTEKMESQITEALKERLDKIGASTDSLSRLSADLRTYHDAIGAADRRWALWHDHVPTYGLFGASSLLGINAFAIAFQ